MLLQAITRACRVVNDVYKARYPIRVGLLQTIFAVSYYGLFRIGELTVGDHQAKACDVHVAGNKDKILIVLRSSKTHGRESRPQEIKITSNEKVKKSINFCPFHLMKTYIQYRGGDLSDDEGFFIFSDGTGVKPTNVRIVLRTILSKLNLEPKYYDTHSFRIGRASDLLKFQVPISRIKQIGRWKSNAVFKYLRDL